MKTNSEHSMTNSSGQQERRGERGNALVYVLIAIVLFAALSFTLARNSDSGEAGALPEERAELYTSQLISYASQVKSIYDQMDFQGARIDQIDFTLPSDTANFDTGTKIFKIYHPEGGGLNIGTLDTEAIFDSGLTTPGDPKAGWYLGRFNNIEWTPTTGTDIVLSAYGIDPTICALINEKVTGNRTIPAITEPLKEVFVQKTYTFGAGTQNNFATGTNTDLTTQGGTPVCAECDNISSLCVQEGGIYGFYTVIADR